MIVVSIVGTIVLTSSSAEILRQRGPSLATQTFALRYFG